MDRLDAKWFKRAGRLLSFKPYQLSARCDGHPVYVATPARQTLDEMNGDYVDLLMSRSDIHSIYMMVGYHTKTWARYRTKSKRVYLRSTNAL